MNWATAHLNHAISILALMVSVLGINGITYFYMHTLTNVQFLFLQLTNITYGIGMAYYAMKFTVSKEGAEIESQPAKA